MEVVEFAATAVAFGLEIPWQEGFGNLPQVVGFDERSRQESASHGHRGRRGSEHALEWVDAEDSIKPRGDGRVLQRVRAKGKALGGHHPVELSAGGGHVVMRGDLLIAVGPRGRRFDHVEALVVQDANQGSHGEGGRPAGGGRG